MAQRKKFIVEYTVDHFPNDEIEVDFSHKIVSSKANEQGCGCGDENCNCNCDDSCDGNCKCACHNSSEAKHKSEYKTSKDECPEGKAWDKKLKKCIPIEKDEAKHKSQYKASKSEEESTAIDYSNRVVKALESKAKNFNKENSPRKIHLNRLKEIYCSAVKVRNKDKNLYALARINKFLEVVADFGSLTAKDLKLALGELDLLGNWRPSEEDLALSEKDIQKYNLNFSFGSIDELFIETSNNRASYEIEY